MHGLHGLDVVSERIIGGCWMGNHGSLQCTHLLLLFLWLTLLLLLVSLLFSCWCCAGIGGCWTTLAATRALLLWNSRHLTSATEPPSHFTEVGKRTKKWLNGANNSQKGPKRDKERAQVILYLGCLWDSWLKTPKPYRVCIHTNNKKIITKLNVMSHERWSSFWFYGMGREQQVFPKRRHPCIMFYKKWHHHRFFFPQSEHSVNIQWKKGKPKTSGRISQKGLWS